MALTKEQENEIISLIKTYLNSNSITLIGLDENSQEDGDIWVFGTQEDVNGKKKSVRIKLSDIKGGKGEDGETTQEVSVYKESETHPDAPEGDVVPPEGWLLKQTSKEGVWWVSKGIFVVDYSEESIKYGRMIGSWSIPYRITVADGDTMYTHYRYYSSESSIKEPPMDTPRTNIESPGPGWEKDYKLVDDPSELQAGIAVYNTEAKPPVYLWETKAIILNERSMHVPWSDPILKSAYGGSKGDTPILDPILNLSANSGHMMCNPDTLDPLPNQSITITANPQNFGDVKDAVFKMVSYKADGQPIDEIILTTYMTDAEEPYATLTSNDWLNTFARVEITCTVSNDNISRSASVIIHRQVNAKPGENAMLAYFLPPLMNIPAHSDGTVPRPNYEEERSYFNLISGNEIIIGENTRNPEIEFIFEGGKLGFEVAIVENGKWKSNISGRPSEATNEKDGTLKIIDFPPGSDNMNIIVKARYKDGSIRNGSASASFSLNKIRDPKEPDSPLDNSETKSFINILTKGYVQPTLYIKPSYIESDTYQKDDYVPNKIIDGDNVSWTPSGSTWYSKKQSVGPIWDHQWVSERAKTNGVWGTFDQPILRNNYPKPPIDTTEVLSVFLENESDNFYREGNSADVFVRAFLGNIPKTPTMIRVDNINGLTGTYDDLFDFEINNDHQRITFTLNKNVNTLKNGKIPISTIVEGQDRVLYFRYSIIPSDSEGGGGGGFLMLSVSSNVMEANVDNSAKPGQEIIIEAKTINVAGDVTFDTEAYRYDGSQFAGFELESTGVSNKKRILSDHWDADIEKVVIEASIRDTNLFDIQTIYKYSRTSGSITGHLTNPHITLYPDEGGGVTYFGSAIGEFHVYDEGVRVKSGVTFSEVDKSDGYNVVIDEETGHYSVKDMTDDNATVTLRAIHESTSTVLDKLLTLRTSSDTIITADSAYLKTACTSNTITRDVTSPSNHKDSDPKIITVEAIHINVDNLKWLFKIDGAGDYIEYIPLPQGVSVNNSGDILTITTEELTGVSTSLGIKVVATITGKDVELVDYENIQIIKTGQNLIPAKTPVTREWITGEKHRNDIDYVDYIYYRDFDTKARNGWFKLTDRHDEYVAPASPYDDSENTTNTNIITINGEPVYEKIEGLETKAFDLVLAEEANLAGFVFKNNILYSQNIKTEDSLPEQFLMLNGHDGKIKAQGVEIEGEIKATSGEIGNFTLENGYLVGYDNRHNPARPTMGLNANADIEERDDNLAFWAGGSFNVVSRHVDNYHSPDPNFVEEDVAYITHSGRAFFSKADIKGRITATRGTIGGFTLGDNFLTGYDSNGHASMGLISNPVVGDDNVAFWVGSRTIGEDSGLTNTIIKHDGTLIARNANITGNITSQSLITRPKGNEYISLNEGDDNQFLFRYPNGGIAIRMGIMDGQPVMIWYNQEGNEVWRGGESGIRYVSGSKATITEVKKIKVADETHQPTTLDIDNPQVDLVISGSLSSVACKDSQGMLCIETSNNNPFYRYWAGVNEHTSINEQYEGLHKDSNVHTTSNWVDDGWYVTQGRIGQFINVGGEGSSQSILIEKYIAGQMVGSTNVRINVNPDSVGSCKYI